MATIIPFRSQFAQDFKRLNLVWLQEYFTVEPYDEQLLSNPDSEIIAKGGRILLAVEGDEVVGTAALLRARLEEAELSKMSVAREWQGRGISKLLMDACIVTAREMGCTGIILYSSTRLFPAIHLYRRYGFREIPLEPDSHYARTDIKMELLL